ncbi:MAG: hypothetical protein ACRENQ_04885 [Gemmatimonadaceae bacterium]
MIGANSGEAMLIIGSFVASLALGLSLQVAYTYTAELFPTRARSSGLHGRTESATAAAALLGPRTGGRRLEDVSR